VSDVPMPRDLSEEKVAVWLHAVLARDAEGLPWPQALARAVRALVEREVAKERASTREKVREAVMLAQTIDQLDDEPWHFAYSHDEIVSRVLGDHPAGGHDEGRPARGEAPRG